MRIDRCCISSRSWWMIDIRFLLIHLTHVICDVRFKFLPKHYTILIRFAVGSVQLYMWLWTWAVDLSWKKKEPTVHKYITLKMSIVSSNHLSYGNKHVRVFVILFPFLFLWRRKIAVCNFVFHNTSNMFGIISMERLSNFLNVYVIRIIVVWLTHPFCGL